MIIYLNQSVYKYKICCFILGKGGVPVKCIYAIFVESIYSCLYHVAVDKCREAERVFINYFIMFEFSIMKCQYIVRQIAENGQLV